MDLVVSEPGCKIFFEMKFQSVSNPMFYMARITGNDGRETSFSREAIIECNFQLPKNIGTTLILEKDFTSPPTMH